MKTKEEIVYTGAFKEIFEGYIAYKISLGFNLEYREQRQLLKLNRHLNRYTTDNVKITKQMVDDYIMTAQGLSSSTIHSLGRSLFSNCCSSFSSCGIVACCNLAAFSKS